MDSKLTAMWVTFFTAAGIPSDVSATYALTFTENRIQTDMLLDLNKEYLKDMGIVRMGDVIAILRHSKQVHECTARDKVLNSAATVGSKVPVAAVTGRTTPAQPSSPASRILEHYTRNPGPEPPVTPHTAVKRRSNEMISPPENMKKRQIRFEAPTQETNEGPPKTVFARLGNSEPPAKVTLNPAKPIYARLGSKPDERSVPIARDALKYEGILKPSPSPKSVSPKSITVTATKNTRKIFTMRADETPVNVRNKIALPKSKSVKFSKLVQYKEIENVKKLNTQAIRPTEGAQIFNKPERRLTIPDGIGVKSRLGMKPVNNLTITKNVFNRLGEV